MQNHDAKAVAYYQKLIATTAVVVPFEEKAALAYARLRVDRSLRPRTRSNLRVLPRRELISSSPTMHGCFRSRFLGFSLLSRWIACRSRKGLAKAFEEKASEATASPAIPLAVSAIRRGVLMQPEIFDVDVASEPGIEEQVPAGVMIVS